MFEVQSLARTLNELLILATIRAGPKHGYQIALEIEERSGGYFGFQHGTLYPILHRLEKEGYIDGAWGSGRIPRRRKEYRITGQGEVHLERIRGEWTEFDARLADFLGGAGEVHRRAAASE